MIRYIYADQLDAFPLLKRSMFRDRADQFKTRLGWDVHVDANGEERDEYDALLAACYTSALTAAARAALDARRSSLLVATPVLGSGARGAPMHEAARTLVRAIRDAPDAMPAAVRDGLRDAAVDVIVRVVVPDAASENTVQKAIESA